MLSMHMLRRDYGIIPINKNNAFNFIKALFFLYFEMKGWNFSKDFISNYAGIAGFVSQCFNFF